MCTTVPFLPPVDYFLEFPAVISNTDQEVYPLLYTTVAMQDPSPKPRVSALHHEYHHRIFVMMDLFFGSAVYIPITGAFQHYVGFGDAAQEGKARYRFSKNGLPVPGTNMITIYRLPAIFQSFHLL